MGVLRVLSFLLICLLISAPSAQSQENNFFVEIARNHVDVSVGFIGDSIDIFGDRRDPSAQVVVVVEGPRKDITLWQKDRVLGAWMNRYYAHFESVPSYYSSAVSSGGISSIPEEMRRAYSIGYDEMLSNIQVKKSKNVDLEEFKSIFYSKSVDTGVYFAEPVSFAFMNEHFFRVGFYIPSSAPTGDYKIRSLLIKDGAVVEQKTGSFKVEQVGLNAFINNAASEYGMLYAIVCLLVAGFSGWLGSVLRVRP